MVVGVSVGMRECQGVVVRAMCDGLVHRGTVEGIWRVIVRLAAQLVDIVAIGRDHHVLTAIALEVAKGGALAHLRLLLNALLQCLHERRAILFGSLCILFVLPFPRSKTRFSSCSSYSGFVIYDNKIDTGGSVIHRPRLPSIYNPNVSVSL